MDNPETLATLGAEGEDKQNKNHNTCVGNHYTCLVVRVIL
jgi:hypothetical protein